MRQELRRRAGCLLLVFCCVFSVVVFPASADSGNSSIEEIPNFTDLPENWWSSKEGFLPFEAAAVKYGLIRGYLDNTFRPEAFLKQGDAVLMLYRLHEKLKGEIPPVADTEEFPEAAGYQREALLWAKAEGLVRGHEPFEPQKEILMDELMVLILRYLQMLGEEKQYLGSLDYTVTDIPDRMYNFLVSDAGRALQEWKLFLNFDQASRSEYRVFRLDACIPFVRLWETLSYRAEESTPRLKLAVEREYPGERWEKSTQNYDMEEPRFFVYDRRI